MVYTKVSTAVLLAFAACVQGHFKMIDPASIGFSDDEEGTAPCGSFTPNFAKDNITDFHVGGQPIALLSTHPESNWLFRASFVESGKGDWQQLYTVQQKGLGNFCIPTVTAPDSWVGKTGVLGIAVDGADGLLYQCASVKFVSGEQSAGNTCKNGTGVTGSFVKDDKLADLATATITPGANATTGSPAATSSASDDKDSAGPRSMGQVSVAQGVIAVITALFCAGYAL